MAEIDKSLPNQPEDIKLEDINEVETVSEEETPSTDEVEVITTEDGGAEVSFDPSAIEPQSTSHFQNLAEVLDDATLDPLGSKLTSDYMDYRSSRKDWEDTYRNGLDLLGFKYERRTEPFRGASGVTHPVLSEAVTQFQAQAYKELLPADGPVRTQILGLETPAKQDQANRVKDFMNYQIMDQMKEYEPEFDQMLFYLPLSGSTFKKVYYDELLGRAVSKFIPADDLVVPYSATNLDDAEAVVHIIKMSENDLRKQQVGGFYRDITLNPPQMSSDEITKKEQELEGIKQNKQDDIYTLLECHVNLDLEGFEDLDSQGMSTGIKLPYVVTVEESSRKVLSIRRNYAENDIKKNKTNYFVHFKFLPGLGFYGFGLIHMIGGLSRTATSALRQLLDAGTLANLPAGFKSRGIRVRDDAQPLQPGEFRDVDAPGGNIRDQFMTLPFKEPSAVLLQLLGVVVGAGQRFAAIADMQVGDMNQQAAVGTTVALLERGSRVMSAVHKRLYVGLKQEFKLLAQVFKTYLPKEYPYDVVGGQRQIKLTDFDDRVDILPIADPNIFSQTQRISLAQTQLQLAQSNPQIHNLYQAYRSMYEAVGVKNINAILPPPQQPMPKDPSLEHIDALAARPFQAFPGQDHRAHIEAHLNFMQLNMVRNAPMVMGSIQKNILEHISIMAQEQVQLEFVREFGQLQVLQPQAQANPAVGQVIQQITQKIEARKAQLIAEMTQEFAMDENKITSQMDGDPLLKLKSREVDLRAMENERKKVNDEERINLDKMKAMMNQANQEEKLEQNEDLAKLRAGVSLAKMGINQAKININD
ncbi:MAG TPA: hypothetical protein VMX17_00780 [Candidatus Glassbacteria bacterium]|jgi:hypothetical protein|nr:hypothetical protein [Candidatus Glassbacteria bacterium]